MDIIQTAANNKDSSAAKGNDLLSMLGRYRPSQAYRTAWPDLFSSEEWGVDWYTDDWQRERNFLYDWTITYTNFIIQISTFM